MSISRRNRWRAAVVIGCALVAAVTLSGIGSAQEPGRAQRSETLPASVPRLIQIGGQLKDPTGRPLTGAVAVTLSVYADEQARTPLWVEVQTLSLDETGRYRALLGAATAEGVPSDLFTTGGARWLGVQAAGLSGESRILLLSVPYALKALDAETLGGRPASDYVVTGGVVSAASSGATVALPGPVTNAVGSDKSIKGLGSPLTIALFTASDTINDSVMTQSATGNVGVGITTPSARLDVALGTATQAAKFTGNSNTQLVESAQSGSGGAIIGVASGGGFGVQGFATNPSGTGVIGSASPATGNNTGVWGTVNSPAGTAGLFDNNGGGTILRGRASGTEMFRVDSAGAVYAGSYRDLAGTPIPNGDITAVGVGTGIAGGGVTGDVSVALDTTYTDARYAAAVHGHVVGDVAGAATTGSNTFAGTQTINGGINLNTSAGSNYAASFRNISTAAGSGGGYGEGTKWGLTGIGSGTGGTSIGVWGTVVSDPAGLGVFGWHNVSTGTGSGVRGTTTSTTGVGVSGDSLATTGTPIGIQGSVLSPNGIAGLFDNTGGGALLVGRANAVEKFKVDGAGNVYANAYRDLAGNPIAAGDVTAVGVGTGITGGGASGDVSVALDTAYTDARYAAAVHGHPVSAITGAATLGANSFAGNQSITGSLAVSADASFDGGIAAFGGPTKPNAVGVRGETTSDTAEGVLGVSISTNGRGVRGQTTGTGGIGIKGEATSATGATSGVFGVVSSAAGTAGLFDNLGGGSLLIGRVGGVDKFKVDGAGAVYATSYRDLAGNPIPGGDITAVGAGTGITGGGLAGDVSVGLDTAFTDARYAALAHTHDVSQVSNAATLGTNSFTGSQSVTGNVTLSGQLSSGTGSFSANTAAPLVNVTQNGNSDGLLSKTFSTFNNAAVIGQALSGSGNTDGVRGSTTSSNGQGVWGSVTSAVAGIGVRGSASGTGGTGVFAVSSASTGGGAGLSAVSLSPSGIAGVFDNNAGGLLLLGAVGGVNKFKVDGAGAVYATSYRDLAGNPIPGGDITAVGAGTGITGGGVAGDVSVALDTAFTDGRYAPAVHGHNVSAITGAATLGANTFNATQTIDTGNVDLDSSTATTGNITKNGTRFLHNFGNRNTFLGATAGSFVLTGGDNTATGNSALSALGAGFSNTATGSAALQANTDGAANTAIGVVALQSNSTGSQNTAAGFGALNHTGGDFNVALGSNAGFNATTGSNNIYLGASVLGVAGESNTMYLGKVGQQSKTFMAGVRGITTVNADAIPVVIDSAGQLGTISSSRRFKEDIREMGDASRRLLQLRPVTFRYTQAYGNSLKPLQFGLVAEEVAEVFPELAVRGANGQIETVHYETLNVLLLNELQQQQKRIERLEQQLNELLAARDKR